MNCEEAKRLLSLYLDDELDPSSREKVSRHLQQCVPCEREMTDLVKTIRLMQGLEMVEPPRDYCDLVKDISETTIREES